MSKSRINICLGNLEIEPIFEFAPESNTIETWFYDSINKFVFNDFFKVELVVNMSVIGMKKAFNWKTEEMEKELEGN